MKSYEFTLEGRDGIYEIVWGSLGIQATIDSMQESRDHEVKGHVRFTSTRPVNAGHLRFSRLNFTSASARNAMAKSLSQREPELNWDTILEQLSYSVLQQFREGTPAVLLDDQELDEQISPWLIEPLVQNDNPTLIYGPGSTGKSWLAQYLAVLADEGISGAGFAVSKVKVLYLDWETDQNELSTRVKMIRRGLGLPVASGIWYRSMRQGLAQDIEAVRKEVITKNIGLVVIDSIGSACMGEPESAEVVLRAFSALRSLGISSLCVDHVNKEGYLFGSVYKFNSARQVFECKKDQQPEDDKLVLGLFHRKANNSKLRKEIGLQLIFGDNTMTIERRDVRDTALEENMRLSDRIENFLRHVGKATPKEIAEELDKTESHIRKELSEGSGRNGKPARFTSLGDGLYGNAYRGEDNWSL